jgi:predicted RNA methylase
VTEALLFLGEVEERLDSPGYADATHYQPTPVGEFEELLAAIPADLANFTFVDVGAGMGRVLMLASLHPFRAIRGIEISGALTEIAMENLRRWRAARDDLRCKDLRVVRADATSWTFPNGDLVVYLYNPFGAATMRRVAARISARERGTCYVLYHTPVHRDAFEESEAFETIAKTGAGAVFALRPDN